MIASPSLFAAKVGRTDSFMRFLRIFGFSLILTGLVRNIASIITVGDGFARSRDGAVIHLHTVCAHIGDGAVFI